ncbi:MAG: hypothetical protein LBL64_01950 [Treponema sp.]|jgi:hypothetical protein|nr:hypothetical protein [Treponema sp.]
MDAQGMDNNIYLNLSIRDVGETDENGNFIFEVEASNPGTDLQNQIVLQEALLESRDHFLTNGVISLDHLHKRRKPDGSTETDLSMVIGEPLEVRTEGKKTIVKGKLYHTNEHAQEIVKLLKAKSTRVKASVGGIWPKVVKDAKTGVEKIVHVLWNDLALTFSPVNDNVSPAYLTRSMDPDEFVKTLMAGHGTDHADFTGGRATIPEDIQTYIHEVTETNAGDYEELKGKILSLLAAMKTGEVKGENEAVKFLVSQGLDRERARASVREILLQGGQL